ncbi:MAG TPA: hypothetical protein VNL77_11760 [Roseiflexaceae bacterium]|nr:hypothetical protein [Roseiflexaceae bacterium]
MRKRAMKDSGWDGLRGTVQRCGSCGRATIHLAARGGVAVCSECGYNPAFEAFVEEPEPQVVRLPEQRRERW